MRNLVHEYTGRKRGASALQHREGAHASVGAGNKDLSLSNVRLAERKESRQSLYTDRQWDISDKNLLGRKNNLCSIVRGG